ETNWSHTSSISQASAIMIVLNRCSLSLKKWIRYPKSLSMLCRSPGYHDVWHSVGTSLVDSIALPLFYLLYPTLRILCLYCPLRLVDQGSQASPAAEWGIGRQIAIWQS